MKNIEKLVLDFIPLANKIAYQKKKNLPKFIDLEDLKSAAYLGLVEAANRFNPQFNVKFSTFAYPRISGSICDYLREYYKTNKNIVSIDLVDDNQYLSLIDIVSAKSECKIEEALEVFSLVLDKQAKKIIQYYFIDGYTMKETGEKLNLSESRVSQLIKFYKIVIKNNFIRNDFTEKLAA